MVRARHGKVARTCSVVPPGAGVSATLYIANSGANTVSVVDTATNTVATTVAVGIGPFGLSLSPDGSRAWVGHNSASSVSVIDTTTDIA